MTFAERNGLIDESQCAYRKGRYLWIIFLLCTQSSKSTSVGLGGRFYVAFIDLSRAFDSVPHSVLWHRMLHEGVHGQIFSVFNSMYADDICIVDDSVGRLQNQLNVLGTFCKNYGLRVNLSKTKVITFRNGGPLRCSERFYLNRSQLECVSHYKYIGIVFTSRLYWSVPLQTLSAQAEKGLFALKRVVKTVGNFPVSLSLDLFDKLILPILLYGLEVWGTQHREPIERAHIMFCIYIMSVSYNTSNAAVLGDLGRTSYLFYINIGAYNSG